jgi:glycosyltransferase involved in cell wall biosynthesis
LATPTNSNIEWNQESIGGYMTKGFDSNDFVEAISLAISSNELWNKKSKSLRSWCVENGDWEISEKQLLKLYESIRF